MEVSVMRLIRIWFKKTDSAKYISHLDLQRCLTRAFRRTDIPLWYTEGFNPHPYLLFGFPLPLGVEGLRETLDIKLTDDSYDNERVLAELNRVTVPGIEFLEVCEPVLKPMDIVSATYSITIPSLDNPEVFSQKIKEEIEKNEIIIQKKTKKGGFKEIIVCENIRNFHCTYDKDSVTMKMVLPAGNDFTINPVLFCNELFNKLECPLILHRIVRCMLLDKKGTEFK